MPVLFLCKLINDHAPSILLRLDKDFARLLCLFGAIPPISWLLGSHGGNCGWKQCLMRGYANDDNKW